MMRAPSTIYPAEAPLCRACGGLFTNPSAPHCRFCNHPANAPAPYRPQPMVHPAHRPTMPMDGGRTSFFWLRVAVIAIASCLSVVAACVSTFAGE
jgi:hypothetical protein